MQEMLGTRETEDGTQIEELFQARASGHQRAWQYVETYPDPRRRQGSCQRGKKTGRLRGKKRRITWKEYRRLLHDFELEGLMAQKGLWNLAREKRLHDRGALPREECDVIREYN